MGLLDQFSEFAKTPAGQGLLSAAFGGLAGARRGTPLNNIGRGGLAGLAGYSGAIDRQSQEGEQAFQKQFRQMQMDDMVAKAQKQKGEQEWRGGLPGVMKQAETSYGAGMEGPTMTPGNPKALDQYLLDPRSPFADDLLKQKIMPKERKTITVEGVVLDAQTMQPIYTAPEKFDPNKPFMKGPDGTTVPNKPFQEYELGKAERGATRVSQSVNTSTPFETEQDKVYGKGIGEMRLDIDRSAFAAPKVLANLDRMEQLLEGTNGGSLAGTAMQVASMAQSMGLKIDPKLGDKEASEALAIEMALAQRPVGSGPMTDKDFENFLNTVPRLAKTSDGRKQITATLRAKAKRDMDIAQLAREHAKRNGGRLTNQFQDELAGYVADNPVWKAPAATPSSGNVRKRADEILKGQ